MRIFKLKEELFNEAFIDPYGKYTDFGTGNVTGKQIFDDKTHISFYDQLLTNPDYMEKEENLKGHIKMMSPREYYEECATKIFNTSVNGLLKGRQRDIESNEEIKEIIVKYKRQVFLPVINYAQKEQEGLHRMLVAAELFSWDDKFPVLVVEWADEEEAQRIARQREEKRIRKHIRDVILDTIAYTFNDIDEFEEQLRDSMEIEFEEYLDMTINSFKVVQRDDITIVYVNGVQDDIETDRIHINPREEDTIELDDMDLDDIGMYDLDWDDFLKQNGLSK